MLKVVAMNLPENGKTSSSGLPDSLKTKSTPSLPQKISGCIAMFGLPRPFRIDLHERILINELLPFLLKFLKENAPTHAIVSSINLITQDLMDIQAGRFFINERELVVEDSAREVWLRRGLLFS